MIIGFCVIIASCFFAYMILNTQQSNDMTRTTNYWTLVLSDEYKAYTFDEKVESLALYEAVTQQDMDRIRVYEAQYFLTLTVGIVLFTFGSSLPNINHSIKEMLGREET